MTLLQDHPLELGGILALLVIVILVSWFLLRRGPKVIEAFDSADGKIWVSERALREITQYLIAKTEGIERAKIDFRIRRKKLYATIAINLTEDNRLTDVASIIQERILEGLKDHLGLEKIGSVEVMVKGFTDNTEPEVDEIKS